MLDPVILDPDKNAQAKACRTNNRVVLYTASVAEFLTF